MQNISCTFGILTRNSNWVHFVLHFIFWTYWEVHRGWDILNLLLHWVFSKVVLIWFVIGQKKATCEPCFWIFSWKVKLRTPVLFGFLDTFINEFKAITVRYLEFLHLLSILNSAVDINQNSFEKCKMYVLLLDL